MKKALIILCSIFILSFWPISLVKANPDTWINFVIPAAVLLLYFLFDNLKISNSYFIFLVLPLVEPVFAPLPVLFGLFLLLSRKINSMNLIYLLLSIIVFAISFKPFYNYSIFTPDPLRYDTLVKKINLIPSRNLARVFENRTTVYGEKFSSNLFLNLDPNNFFFSLHPREISGENQNLQKFPSLAILFLFCLLLGASRQSSTSFLVLSVYVCSILSLAFINNPDKFDFILYAPVSLLIISGIKKLSNINSSFFYIASIAFLITSTFEFIRLIYLP